MNEGMNRENVLRGLLAGLLIVLLISGSSCSAGPESTSTGTAIDFKLQEVNGSWVQLSDFKGKKPVLLYFWAIWCPACIEAKPQLVKLRERIDKEDLEILGINVGTGDSFERVQKYQQGHPMPWPVLYDKEGQISGSYGVHGIPLFILMDKEGKVVYRDHVPPENPNQYF